MVRVLAKIFKALGDATRLRITQYLLFEDRCACEFSKCVGKDQTTVSRHLKVLVGAGVLKREKRGRNIIYSVRDRETRKQLERFGLKPSSQCC